MQGKTLIVCYSQKIVNCTLKNAFLNQLNSLKKIVSESDFDRSAALPELPFLAVFC